MRPPDDLRLNQPVYAALTGAQSRFAEIRGRVVRYPADVAPFLAVPGESSAEDWVDATYLVPAGTHVAVQRPSGDTPDHWTVAREFEVLRWSSTASMESMTPTRSRLADVPEMLELVRETDPGPFLERTIELGRYVGLRCNGGLIAMAGERFHFDGWREISAVCTAPTHRGQGLASRLVLALSGAIHRRSERAFLYVLSASRGELITILAPLCDERLGRSEPEAATAAGHEVHAVAQSEIHASSTRCEGVSRSSAVCPDVHRFGAQRTAAGAGKRQVCRVRAAGGDPLLREPQPRGGGFRSARRLRLAPLWRRGAPWTWLDGQCASWPALATDRYAVPWNRRTAHPVLVIGTTYDPATPYQSAVALSHQLARARLLTIDGYGHTSGASTCAHRYETRYLISGTLPPRAARCAQDKLPFTG